jgi:transposase
MERYVGLDVSLRETAICVIDAAGKRVWQGSAASTPEALAAALRRHAPTATKVAFETGPLAAWLWHELRSRGFRVICLHARHARAALAVQLNKTDANDAHGLAQIIRAGWYREVEIKSWESYRVRSMLSARADLVSIRTRLTNQIRGLLKTFGVVLSPGKGGRFAAHVRAVLPTVPAVAEPIEALLLAWDSVRVQAGRLERALLRHVREQAACQRLMSAPGVGAVTAAAFVAAIDNPHRFGRSRDVGAYLGLTPRRYQSGQVDRTGRISKCGDALVRTYLYEAAHALLTRVRRPSALRTWGLRIAQRNGTAKARVAVARKLAVILHRMWLDETTFTFAAVAA